MVEITDDVKDAEERVMKALVAQVAQMTKDQIYELGKRTDAYQAAMEKAKGDEAERKKINRVLGLDDIQL